MQRRGSVPGSAGGSRVRVAVRVRPPEYRIPKDESRPPCVTPSAHAVNAVEFQHDAHSKAYTFDHVFGSEVTQEDVYAGALQPLMAQFLDGYNVTVMAYGQTGSGKTYTMGNKAPVLNTTPTTSPSRDRSSSLPMPTVQVEARNYRGTPEDGLMPRFLFDLFTNLKTEPSLRTIKITFVEIYCDTIRDLLDDREKSLTIREDPHNVWVENVRSFQVESLPKALELLNLGRSRQTIGANALNDQSSRSHAVYTMEVTRKFQSEIKKSKLTFVDLAGSERLKKTQVDGVRKRESIQINVGLSALGNVINALADEKAVQKRSSTHEAASGRPSSPCDGFVPYRTAKLTRLLRDALGGNSRTLFIACVSPLDSNADETLSTLQYANRARNIQNKAEKNIDHDHLLIHPNPSELEVLRLQEEVARLKEHILDLTAAARSKEDEIMVAEQVTIEKKQCKRESRRDAEVTTEIEIQPHVDAQTQVEGQSTGEERRACAEATTNTDTEPFPLGPSYVDSEAQSETSYFDLLDVGVGTDKVVVSEHSTETSIIQPHDVGVATDEPYPGFKEPVLTTDASTQPADEHGFDHAIGTDASSQTEIRLVRGLGESSWTSEFDFNTGAGHDKDFERTAGEIEVRKTFCRVEADEKDPLPGATDGPGCFNGRDEDSFSVNEEFQSIGLVVINESPTPRQLQSATALTQCAMDDLQTTPAFHHLTDQAPESGATGSGTIDTITAEEVPVEFECGLQDVQPALLVSNTPTEIVVGRAHGSRVCLRDSRSDTKSTKGDCATPEDDGGSKESSAVAEGCVFYDAAPIVVSFTGGEPTTEEVKEFVSVTKHATLRPIKFLAPETDADAELGVSSNIENQAEADADVSPAFVGGFGEGYGGECIEGATRHVTTADTIDFIVRGTPESNTDELGLIDPISVAVGPHSNELEASENADLLQMISTAIKPSTQQQPESNGESAPSAFVSDGSPQLPDFVHQRSPRRKAGERSSSYHVSAGLTPSSRAVIRPLKMFTFDDGISTPAEETASTAKALCNSMRDLVRDDFGELMPQHHDEECESVKESHDNSPVHQLLHETKDYIMRRRRRQQRIVCLRRRVIELEAALEIQNRAPVSDSQLQAYSKQTQEDFLTGLIHQLITLAAERLHCRLSARLQAEELMPLSTSDDNENKNGGSSGCPFLSLRQCHACAEWFVHRTNDIKFFEAHVLPLVTSGWISLSPHDLEAERSWFEL